MNGFHCFQELKRDVKKAPSAQSCSRTGLMELTLPMTQEIPPVRCNLLRRATRRASRIRTSSQRHRGIGQIVHRWQSGDSGSEQPGFGHHNRQLRLLRWPTRYLIARLFREALCEVTARLNNKVCCGKMFDVFEMLDWDGMPPTAVVFQECDAKRLPPNITKPFAA